MQAVEGVGGLGEQGRVAKIPLGELAVAADAERRVDVQLEVEPEASRGLDSEGAR
jgi:hypothetical protein